MEGLTHCLLLTEYSVVVDLISKHYYQYDPEECFLVRIIVRIYCHYDFYIEDICAGTNKHKPLDGAFHQYLLVIQWLSPLNQ